MTHDTLRAAAEAAKEALNDICAELGARLAPEESFDVRDALVKKFGVVEELIATLSREPEAAAPAQGEREAFEAWAEREFSDWYRKPPPGTAIYDACWHAWQARAAIPHPPVEGSQT
jgi:hypothetical protein